MDRATTVGELMVAAAAREIQDGEVVFVGMRLPLIAFVVAKRTHAPRAIGLFENGVIRATPSSELIYTMADPPNIFGATQCLDMLGVMSLLQSGRVDLGFLGAAEVDRFGNLNSTVVRVSEGHGLSHSAALKADTISQSAALKGQGTKDSALKGRGFSRAVKTGNEEAASAAEGRFIRLPGSGGACDIASLSHRFVVLLEHSKHRLPERVSYITSPGHGDGRGWRERAGLPRGGPSAVITTKAVLRFGEDGEAYLASVHPGGSVEEVLANTGWKLRVAANVEETPHPTPKELEVIRDYDKDAFWTG